MLLLDELTRDGDGGIICYRSWTPIFWRAWAATEGWVKMTSRSADQVLGHRWKPGFTPCFLLWVLWNMQTTSGHFRHLLRCLVHVPWSICFVLRIHSLLLGCFFVSLGSDGMAQLLKSPSPKAKGFLFFVEYELALGEEISSVSESTPTPGSSPKKKLPL